jgi:hypothetical protein
VIEGGWVCRACWHANLPRDDRCYRCHTPRDQQLSVEAGSLKEQTEPDWELKGRLDAGLPILANVAAWLLRVTGVLNIVYGAAGVLVGLFQGDEGLPTLFGMPANIWVSLSGMMFVLVGSLKIFVASSVQRFVRWAYVATLVLTVASFAYRMLVPPLAADAEIVAVIRVWADTWFTLGVILCAAALLLTSFIRDEVERPPRIERPPQVEKPSAAIPSATEQAPGRPAVRTRLDTDLPFLTFLAVLPMRLYGIFAVGLGILIVVLGLLSGSADSLGVAAAPVAIAIVIAVGVITSLYGVFLNFLASRVGRHARWAYIVALLLFLVDSVPRLLGVKPEFGSDVLYIVWLTSAWVSFGTAVCIGTLLLTSFVLESAE